MEDDPVLEEEYCTGFAHCLRIQILTYANLPAFAQRTGELVPSLLQSSPIVTTSSTYLFAQMRPYRKKLVLLLNPLDLGKNTIPRFKDSQ